LLFDGPIFVKRGKIVYFLRLLSDSSGTGIMIKVNFSNSN